MNITINNKIKQPIYEQIKNQIKEGIIKNNIDEKTPLPSIRKLSKDIETSVMTVKKAYDELLEEGFIITIPGKGSYINKNSIKKVRNEKINEIEQLLSKAIDIAKNINITKEELLNHYLKLENKKRGN